MQQPLSILSSATSYLFNCPLYFILNGVFWSTSCYDIGHYFLLPLRFKEVSHIKIWSLRSDQEVHENSGQCISKYNKLRAGVKFHFLNISITKKAIHCFRFILVLLFHYCYIHSEKTNTRISTKVTADDTPYSLHRVGM